MPIDPQTQQNVNDFQFYVQDTLKSISTKFSEAMADAVDSAFDGLDKKVISSVEKDLTKTFKSLVKSSDDISLNIYKLKQGLIGSKDLAKQQADIDEKRILLNAKINYAKALGVELDEEDLGNVQKALDYQQKELDKAAALNSLIEKRLGITGKLVGALGKIPGIGKFIKADELESELKKAASNGAGQFKVFGLAAKNAFGQIIKGLTDPLFLITTQIVLFAKLFKLAKELDQTVTDTARTLGVSKNAAEELNNSYAKYAANVGDSFLNSQMLLENQIKLNKELGTSIEYSAENLEGAARLSHFYGLSEQSSAKMVELATEQGKSSLDILRSTSKTYTLQKAQLGGTMSLNKVLDKVANVSDDIYVRFKGNPEAIAKAVMQANRLGLELEQVNKIGDSLLDFEQSIENELKAELLTGKAINLEKAREYALMGDTENLTKEIAKQVGNIHQFEKMNVIQRKAYAEAMGMSVQEMASMLRKQEFEAKLSEDAKKSAKATLEYAEKHGIKLDDALKAQYEQKSLAEEQHEVFKNLNVLLANLTKGPMSTFINMINKALHGAQGMVDALNKLTGGGLGNALGAAILGAPLIIGAVKGITGLFSGGLKGMFFQRGTYPNPMIVRDISGGAGGGGVTDMLSGGFGGKRSLVKRFGAKGARNLIRGAKGFGIGMAVGIGSDLIAGQMEEGGAKDTVSGVGTVASYAGTGAMIGSVIPGIGTAVGGVIGGAVGAIKAFYDAESNRKEREEARKKAEEDQKKRTNDLLEQLALRPNVLNVGGKTIMEFNTASDQFGTRQSSFS